MIFSKLRSILFILLISIVAVSCINLKSDYPQINYYSLNQDALSIPHLQEINSALQIRDFSISYQYSTDHIIARWTDTKTQVYFYHRWITDFDDLSTDFIITRFNNVKLFKKGVVGTKTTVIPEYILEGEILDVIAKNSTASAPGDNFVSLSIRISVIKRNPMKNERNILISKVYEKRVNRNNSSVATIPTAFSKAISTICDEMIVDIQEAIQ